MKPSKAQLDVLRLLDDEGELFLMPDGKAFTDHYRYGEETVNKNTFRILLKGGYIQYKGDFGRYKEYELSNAGRAALSEAEVGK